MDTNSTNKQYLSLGRCCQLLSCNAADFRRLAQGAKVAPAMSLDSVEYYTPDDLEKVRKYQSQGKGFACHLRFK
ncbi:hypothetical protein Pan181_18890 [Aeoliella mucimassa]|uniref:Uncharacterized protein n=1 Tax=Aeoliella mucimassa TaxID=2527972 RepID=A0A518ALU2_9BACT|nr:hypothetical protein Pan181_18890 [Aeoliella mucimassa]